MTLFSDLEKIKTPQETIKVLYNKISSVDKFAYAAGFISCLLMNMFVYTNTCFAHDSIQIYNDSTGMENGRFLVGPLLELVNRMQLPWVIGLISCFLMGFIVVYISKIFKLNNKLYIVLAAGFVVTSEAMVVSHAYFSSVHIYILSLLLSVVAVYYADKGKVGYLISVCLLCLSMMCYQTYIATAIGLFIFKMLVSIVESNNKIKVQIFLTIKYATSVIVSVVLYYGIWKSVNRLTNTQVVDYYAYKNLGTLPSAKVLWQNISYAFEMATQFLYRNDIVNINPLLMICCLLALVITAFFFFGVAFKKRRLIFTLVYIVTYILSINVMYIISGTVVHALMVFSIIIPFLAMLYCLENIKADKKISNATAWVSTILAVVIIFSQAVYGNSIYLKIKTNYDNAWSYSTRLLARLEQTEGFNSNSKLVLVSNGLVVTEYKQNDEIKKRAKYDVRFNILHDCIDTNNAITYADTLKWFIQQEMDMNIDIDVNPERLCEDETVENMPIFPAEGSIQIIEGQYIVKV